MEKTKSNQEKKSKKPSGPAGKAGPDLEGPSGLPDPARKERALKALFFIKTTLRSDPHYGLLFFYCNRDSGPTGLACNVVTNPPGLPAKPDSAYRRLIRRSGKRRTYFSTYHFNFHGNIHHFCQGTFTTFAWEHSPLLPGNIHHFFFIH